MIVLEGDFPEDFPGKETVIQVRAGCFFRRAIQLANKERFDEAVADMRRAQALVPDNETVREQLTELEQIKKDFPYIKAMQQAESLLEKEQFQEALNAMQSIPASFRGHKRAQNIRAVCEFRLGVQCANAKNLFQAIQHLEQAESYEPSEPAIKQQLAELRTVQRMGGFEAIERRNRAMQKAQEVVSIINAASKRNPLTPQRGFELLAKLEEAVNESGGDPQITSLRDQLSNMLMQSLR